MNDNFTASGLTARKNLSDLNSEVEDIYVAIKQRIQESESINQSEILFELPTHFSVANLELHDLQLVIYTKVIEILKNKGFEVYFIDNKGFSLLIKWTSTLAEQEKAKMKEFLISHMPKKEDIDKIPTLQTIFKKPALPAPSPVRHVFRSMKGILPNAPPPKLPTQTTSSYLADLMPNYVHVAPRISDDRGSGW